MASSEVPSPDIPPIQVKRKPLWLLWIIVPVALCFAAWITMVALAVHEMLNVGIYPGPTLIEELRSGAVTKDDVASIEILKHDPRAGLPFTEEAYAQLEHRELGQGAPVERLIELLRQRTTDGYGLRDHPIVHHTGFFRIRLRTGGHYYLLYDHESEKGLHFAGLTSLSKLTTNPNGGKPYENIPLAEFLKEHDPWYEEY